LLLKVHQEAVYVRLQNCNFPVMLASVSAGPKNKAFKTRPLSRIGQKTPQPPPAFDSKQAGDANLESTTSDAVKSLIAKPFGRLRDCPALTSFEASAVGAALATQDSDPT
jgi:hypothetical protein